MLTFAGLETAITKGTEMTLEELRNVIDESPVRYISAGLRRLEREAVEAYRAGKCDVWDEKRRKWIKAANSGEGQNAGTTE